MIQSLPVMHTLINGVSAEYISLMDRGFQYGDGLFETIACRNGRLEFLKAHFERMQQGAERLNIPCPDLSLWLDDISEIIRPLQNSSVDCVVKLILTRGYGERGYYYKGNGSVNRIVQLTEGLPLRYYSDDGEVNTEPARVCICRHPVSTNPVLAGLKHLNRLDNVMARNEWEHQYTEGLMRDAGGHVIEGTMSNVFGVKDGKLFTPLLNGSGVSGIIRSVLLRLAETMSIPFSVKNLTLDNIQNMDEIFICNSLIGILPVTSINSEKSVWQATSCTLTEKLNIALQKEMNDHAQAI